jgi:fibronectin type 3 domain-containing protein
MTHFLTSWTSRQGKKSANKNRPKASYRPMLEPLEDRITPYVVSGYAWVNTNISASFMPDGTSDMGYQSDLFALYNASYPTATWQLQFAKALQTWADASSLNFHFVTEQIDPTTGVGYASGTPGLVQGDPRFGDIRLGASTGIWGLGHAVFPGGSTIGGDITLNGAGAAYIGSSPDLYSILLHEAGAALGLGEGSAATSVMNGPGPYTGLYADDIAGIQALYGAPPPDGSNGTLASATSLTLSSGAATINSRISSLTDVDYYRVTVPAGSNALIVSADARGISLFDPKISVYDLTGKLLATASASTYGSVATAGLSGLLPGQSYILQVDGATSDVFGMGAYQLSVQFTSGITNVDPPTGLTATPVGDPQVVLQWTNNAANATANVVERSSDGVNWTQIASLPANSTSYTDPNVPDGVTYYYEVWAVNGLFSSPSNLVSVTLFPLAPGGLKASAVSSNQINLSWSDVLGETGFTIQRSVDGITWTQIATTGGGVTSYQDTGLTGSTTYEYEVSASNAGGTSAYSNPVSASTFATVPDAPTGLTASTVSTSQIDLAWNAVTGATGYKIDRSANGVTWVRIAATTSGVTSFRSSGLLPGITYYYRVEAVDAVGLSAPSDPTSAATLQRPNAPTGLTATTISCFQINLAWNSAVGVGAYRIERSADGVNWALIGTTLGTVTNFQNPTGLYAGHTYFYRVRACASGRISDPSNQVSATTITQSPTALVAATASPGQINLTWNDVFGETGFLIERSQDGINWTTVGSTGVGVTSFQDSGLLVGTRYIYRVRASNSGGISAASNLASAVA